jgi:hypothetical protein
VTVKRFWPLFLMLVSCSAVWAQEVKHAPTVEQCRADQKLWLAKLEEPGGITNVRVKELHGWQGEMRDCKSVDPEYDDRYYNVTGEIQGALLTRFADFLIRHNLFEQFTAEDAQGKR